MGFSQKIKEDVLVASARHCCACKRYKGVKVEVHHIKPQEQGGKDTFENAIPLCFDCHSDAGHYFAKHPKGTKFSPAELRKHKKAWFDIVKNSNIPQKNNNQLHTRYLITKEFDVIKGLSDKDLSDFPIENCLLAYNDSLESFKNIFSKQSYRNTEIENILSFDEDEYLTHYPDATKQNTKEGEHQYLYHERAPTKDDIEKYCEHDNLSLFLINNGVNPKDIAKVYTCYEDECAGEGNFEEIYILKPLYFKFLVITNITSDYIILEKLVASEHLDFLYNESSFDKEKTLTFPNVLIEPKQSVLVPLGMFFSDYNDLDKSNDSIRIKKIGGERTIVLEHVFGTQKSNIDYLTQNYLPKTLQYNLQGESFVEELHEFDFENIYWIDGYWTCGSCPHLFFKKENSDLLYKGELFNSVPGKEFEHTFLIERNIKEVIIAELEHEITTILSISLNGELIFSNVNLIQGQELRFIVSENDMLEIRGYYNTLKNTYKTLPIFEKHLLISNYKRNSNIQRRILA